MKLLRFYDEADGAGSTTVIENPTPEQVQASAQSQIFGLTEDPLKPSSQSKEPTSDDKDPSKKEPTSVSDGGDKLLAGKYKTAEDLAKGYDSLLTQQTTLSEENKKMRDQLDQLTTNLLKEPDKSKSKTDGPTPEATKLAAKMADARELIKENYGDEMLEAFESLLPKTAESQPIPPEVQAQLDQLAKLIEKDEKTTVEASYTRLTDRHKDSAKPEVREKMDVLMKQITENPDDQDLSLDVLYKASAFDDLPAIADKMAREMLTKLSTADKEKWLAESLGGGGNAGGGTGGGSNLSPMEQNQISVFGVGTGQPKPK